MKKDIQFPKVEDVSMAVVQEGEDWCVYLINQKDVEIYGTLVTSNGYGTKDDEKVETSTIRQFIDKVPPNSAAKVEQIMPDVFGLINQYWVSFYVAAKIYDKKYIFLPESIVNDNLIKVPVVGKKGVMIG